MTAVDVWTELEGEVQSPGPGSVRRRMGPHAPCDIFLALELPSERPMLVMTAPAVAAAQLEGGEWSLGVETELIAQPDGRTDVCLKLTDRRFIDVFGRLADDMIEAVTTQPTAKLALQEFGSRFLRWQRFLERAQPDGLSLARQMGLYGELWTLMEFLLRRRKAAAAADAWVGPLGANQDFQLGNLAIEVKCTGTKLPVKVRIQSERQLDETGVEALYLLILVLDVREGGDKTLADIVASVRQEVSADAKAASNFEERLLQMGYLDAHGERYGRRSYVVRETHVCQVTLGFPRIVGSQLSQGIGDVRYSLGLPECLPFEVGPAALTAALESVNA